MKHGARRRSLRSGILHSLRLQEPQTGASIWASASRLTPLHLSRCPLSPFLLPSFGRAPRLEDPSPPPFFLFFIFYSTTETLVPKWTNCPVIVLFRFSPPLPLSSIYRCAGRIALLLCFSSSLSVGGKVSRFFCVPPLPPSPPFDGFVSLLSRDVSSYIGRGNFKGFVFF